MPTGEKITSHSDEVQEIITAVPSWILRWGIMLIFAILAGIVGLSALIKYPDVVKVPLKVSAGVAPKVVLAKQAGRIELLLAKEDQLVRTGQALAFLESTAKHQDVLKLGQALRAFRLELGEGGTATLSTPENGLDLGELQPEYQAFYQQYLKYRATLASGYYQRKKAFLKRDLQAIAEQKKQIERQREIQRQAYKNVAAEYEAYRKLYQTKVISPAEFRQQQNKYFDGQSPLQQADANLLNNSIGHAAKEKELFDLENTVTEDRSNFMQSLNGLMAATESWLLIYVPRAPVAGRLSYAGVLQNNQNVEAGQELFVVNSGGGDFFGDVRIPQQNMGKVKLAQRVLVKLYGYPYEQFGMIRGRINFISDAAYRDSVFSARVRFEQFENKDPRFKIHLKNGMMAQAEIVTEDNTLLQRFVRNITAMLKNK